MTHNITGLAEKIRILVKTISDLRGNEILGVLGGIIHRPGWTTLRELEFVTESVDSLQRQVDTVKNHYIRLIRIADKIGKNSEEKPEFGPAGLQNVVTTLNQEFSALLATNWRQFARDTFHLHPDQERSLLDISNEKAREIQTFFAEAALRVGRGEHLLATIVSVPPEQRTPQAAHELRVGVEGQKLSPEIDIVIAHCDADCKNWGWGPAPKQQ